MFHEAAYIFEEMKKNYSGWYSHHFHTLYLGFGFKMIEAKYSYIFSHPEHPKFKDQIPISDNELGPGYVKDAVRNIEYLIEVTKGKPE